MKKSTKFLLIFSGLLVLSLLVPWLLHYGAEARLEAYKRKLVAAGEKLAISELTPSPDLPGQSNAAALLEAAKRLTPIINYYPSAMKMISPGRARVAWREAELNQEVYPAEIFTNVWPLLRIARTNNEEAMVEIRGILSTGPIQFPFDFQKHDFSSGQDFSHFTHLRSLSLNTGGEVMLDLHDGLTNKAMETLLSCVEVPKLCDEPLEIGQLIRYAEVAMAVESCWESLQFKGWTDEQLAQLQKQWEAIDLLSAAANSVAMERAMAPMYMNRTRGSKKEFDGLVEDSPLAWDDIWDHSLVNPWEGVKQLTGAIVSYPCYWIWSGILSYEDERLSMQYSQEAINALRAAPKRQAAPDVDTTDMSNFSVFFVSKRVRSKFPASDSERPMLKKFVGQALRAQTEVEIVIAAITLERYALRHHQYPAHLEELVPLFVKRVPVDYMDGKDLRYRLQPDGSYLLYSVGENRTDDGGDPTPTAHMSGWLGRDWVWPGIATAQETSAYEADEAQKMAEKQALREKPGHQ